MAYMVVSTGVVKRGQALDQFDLGPSFYRSVAWVSYLISLNLYFILYNNILNVLRM